MLSNFSNLTYPSIILTDSNLNLLKTRENALTESYVNTVHSNGFLFVQNKATRQNQDSLAHIDHIFTNVKLTDISSGVLVDDLSDHFPNFIQIPSSAGSKPKCASKLSRSFNHVNITTFLNNLNNTNWNSVYASNDVNLAFENFWDVFNNQFNLNFPLKSVRHNRNIHKINEYMTVGLLTSRRNKLLLHKLSVVNPTPENRTKYKEYRNTYNSLVRLSKKMYFTENLELNKHNPKKMWDLLREATTGHKQNCNITQINNGNLTLTDPVDIAEKFNDFFSTAGNNISNSIPPFSNGPFILH
jgi:hypothetical protein